MSFDFEVEDNKLKQREQTEHFRRNANVLSQRSIKATRDLLRLCHESQDAGAKTLELLHRQGDQLFETEEKLDQVSSNLTKSHKNLDRIKKEEKIFHCCVCCNGSSSDEDQKLDENEVKLRNKIGKNEENKSNESKIKQEINKQSSHDPNNEKFIKRITNDEHEDELESNLKAVSTSVSQLKNLAININESTSAQNLQAQKLIDKTHKNTDKIKDAQKKAQALLK